ncbi:hypothetical protein [Tessaracoccus lacteus]|uniref:Uncharacterized protein n=1 Tax=Tessaracoccus lacteus TaxID=3041766 RepID=A0ABY8PYQ0_9ACTN|nr:hypothetical protein [Tessaracoccus sp. T21]WGT47640.1 hypothetical protein QH948_02350 [Tessaracoccus sp. T21]
MGTKGRKLAPIRLEVPYTAPPPELTSLDVGIARLLRRPSASYELEVTVLDAPDGRLLRDGVIVAHRVVGGIGQWFLSAAGWRPHLPARQIEPLGADGDLPPVFAQLLRPLIRHQIIGPLAGLHCVRDEWTLRGVDGSGIAHVRDEKVRVRRDSMTTARYREVTITPARALTGDQRRFLLAAADRINATEVDAFPSLQRRLGAPATGLTNFPPVRDTTRDDTLEEFVSAVFCRHLHAIVTADLDRRAAGGDDLSQVNDRLWAFGRDLRGLASVLDPSWRESVEKLLVGLPFSTQTEIDPPTLAVLDALVGAVPAPRLGDLSQRHAAQMLFQPADQGASILGDRCLALTVDAPDEQWQAALRAAEQLEVVAAVATPLFGKELRRLRELLDVIIDELRDCALGPFRGEPELDGLSARQAYQLGVDTERTRSAVAHRRQTFIDQWPSRVEVARKQLRKARNR